MGARPHGRGTAREVQGCQGAGGRDEAAGVFIFTGGLDDAAPVFSVDASTGTPLFTDGPFIESKEHLGGFTVVDVADEDAARLWAGKIAVACGWPQEMRPFMVPMQLPETS
ncbi:MAG: YciI family protein [Streptosporangiaceae bacterium]